MSGWQELFVHCAEFGVIICRKCRFAVVPVQVERHVKDHHPFVPKQRRISIAQSVNALDGVAHRLQDIRYPAADQEPVANLPVYRDGLQCQECGYICRSIQGIQKHSKTQHGWVNKQKRGRGRCSSNCIWNVGVPCQRFFEYRQWQRLFAVKVDSEEVTASSRRAGQEIALRILSGVEAARNTQQAERRVAGISRRVEANSWLDFVGWHRHLAGVPVKDLGLLISPARGEKEFDEGTHKNQDDERGSESEAALARGCQATRRMIRSAFATSTVEHVGRAALESVNRRETGVQSSEKPFYAGLKVQSLRKYMRVWVEMLRYIWRTEGCDDVRRYRVTERQRRALQRFRVACEKGEGEERHEATQRQEAAEKASAVFWIAMFDQELGDDEFESGIVSALAVLGLDERGDWKAAVNYTQVLSAVITTMRAVVVYRAWLSRQQAIQRAVDDGESLGFAVEAAPSVVSGVSALTERFMTMREYGGMIGPMDRLYRQRSYGLKIRYTTKATGRIGWQGEQLLIDNVSFGLDDVRSVVHGLVETVGSGLTRDLLSMEGGGSHDWKPDGLPTISMERLFDNPAELSAGWSFLQDARTEWAVDGRAWMMERVFAEGKMRRAFVQYYNEETTGLDDVAWNEAGVERYFRAVRRWKEQLIVLVHLSAGAPARATELLSIQHRNGPEARAQRGIFIENQMMAFVTTYHKGYSASGRYKTIHRFVPDEVAEMVCYFLWLVQPFVEHLQFVTGRHTGLPTSFLWEPEAEEDWQAGEDEEEGNDESDQEASADEGDEGDGEGGGKGVARVEAASMNVDGFWDTNRVRRVMQRESEKRIGVKIGVALWRQAYPAIQRQHSIDSNVRETIDRLYEETVGAKSGNQSIEEVRAKQAGHGLHVEEMIYGLLLNESPFTTMHEREQFRQVSMDWHRMLHFRSAWQADGRIPKRVKQQVEAARSEARRWRYKQMRSVDIDAQLKRITQNEKAEFRGVQREGLQAIVGCVPRVTIVMRTGGGKSLFFMIPAAGSRDGVTIVVVPVVSLRQDLVDRCEKVGLSIAAWDGSRPPYHARIIFITPESAVTLGFGRFIDEKRASHQLERIVIDECHTMLEVSATWRPKVLQLQQMAQKDVQVVYLTATLPPSEEEAWLSIVGVARKDMHMIRETTSRANIAYSVVTYNVKEEEQRVKALVERKLAQHADRQVIVYCRRIEQVKRIAEYTGGQAYYRSIGTSEVKAKILRGLTGHSTRLFVATNALGLGVDAPRIGCVIHVGSPMDMKQYAQESGRAGRDGVASEAIVMRGFKHERGVDKVDGEWKIERTMLQFLEGSRCRRTAYDRYMDGRTDRVRCEDREERCDVCEASSRRVKRGRLESRGVDMVGIESITVGGGRQIGADLEEECEREFNEAVGKAAVGVGIAGKAVVGVGVVEKGVVGIGVAGKEAEDDEVEDNKVDGVTAQIQAIQRRGRMKIVQGYIQAEEFEALLRQWQGRCSICIASGTEEGGHNRWRECRAGSRLKAVEKCWDALGGVRYRYSGCFKCHAPQSICESWVATGGSKSGRFVKRQGGMKCQFKDVVRDVGAAIWGVGSTGRVKAWLSDQIEQGLINVEADKENRGREAEVEWFGRRFVEGGIEVSGLCKMIWEFGQLQE